MSSIAPECRSMEDPLFNDVFTSSEANELSKNSDSNIFSMPVYDTPVYDEDIFYVFPRLVSKSPPPSLQFDEAAKDEGVVVYDDEESDEAEGEKHLLGFMFGNVVDDIDLDFSFNDLCIPSTRELDDLHPIQFQELGYRANLPQFQSDTNQLDTVCKTNCPEVCRGSSDHSSDGPRVLDLGSSQLESHLISGYLNIPSELDGSNKGTSANCGSGVDLSDCPSPETRAPGNFGSNISEDSNDRGANSVSFSPHMNKSLTGIGVDQKIELPKINVSSSLLKRKRGCEELPFKNVDSRIKLRKSNCTSEINPNVEASDDDETKKNDWRYFLHYLDKKASGFKSLSKSLGVRVPFMNATLFTPTKCFERAAEKCNTDNLSSIVGSCAWGKHVSVGTESSFEIVWGTKHDELMENKKVDVCDFLRMMNCSKPKDIDTSCLGAEIKDQDDYMDFDDGIDFGLNGVNNDGLSKKDGMMTIDGEILNELRCYFDKADSRTDSRTSLFQEGEYDAVEYMTWWLRKLYFGFYLFPS